jgi:uncharacterized protein
MRGITFNNLPPIKPPEPDRMDVACFIGFAPLTKSPMFSETLKRWLTEHGWDRKKIEQLSNDPALIRNTPVPLESWDAFCAIFDDTRLDRIGELRSRTLENPLTVAERDRIFHVIVDRSEFPVNLEPDANSRISLESLVKCINDQLRIEGSVSLAFATLDPDTGSNLVIKRSNEVTKGELTVYRNESLGFPESVQSDSFHVQNYSAAAVKAFFRQGGKKCYFISMGNPLPCDANDEEKNRQLYKLIWGKKKAEKFFGNERLFARDDFLRVSFPQIPDGVSPVDEWNGLSHLAALSDVTYVCFPDLVDVLGKPLKDEAEELTAKDEEVFVVCSETTQNPPWYFTGSVRIPEYDDLAYKVWKRIVEHIIDYLSVNVGTVQLVAGLPMPEHKLRRDFSRFVSENLLSQTEYDQQSYRHLQLVFPWLKTGRSDALPESLEPPEGVFLGLLAGQSRRIGAFRSIAGSSADDAYDLAPRDIDAYSPFEKNGLSFADRVSWFDFVPDGIALQSDVTASLRGNYRYGAVRRIMILVQRAAHRIGLDHVFEPGSEKIWRTVRESLNDLLYRVYLRNGLRGKSSKEAYSVSCGRSTMTQNDIDNGRLIANVTLQPAVPIERIAVDILLEPDGTVLVGNTSV